MVTRVKGDAAADLFNKGLTAFQNDQYADAAQALQQILDSYPTFAQIDNAHILAGQAYFYAENYPKAIAALQKEAAPNAKPDYRGQGLFLTALAQFYQAQKNTSQGNIDKSGFSTAVTTLTTLTDYITANPTPDNKGFLEQALYFRSLANYQVDKYDASVTDLITLTTDPAYTQSLSRPDYLLQLGDVYSIQASNAIQDKKSPELVADLGKKAIDTLDQAIKDPNALIQANNAAMSKAQVEVMLATLNNNDSAGYQLALDSYRLVRRKADLIVAQTTRLQQLRDKATQIARNNATGAGPTVTGNQLTLLISREQGALDALKDAPDPIIDALIGIADCYINIGPTGKKESDEARTILHRLVAHAKLTDAQQKRVDLDLLLSYVLGGQTDKATKALDDYLAKHKGDPNASTLSLQIAQQLFKRKDYEGALTQTKRSLTDFPDGPNAMDAVTLEAQVLTALGRTKESSEVVENFLKGHSTSPQAFTMVLSRGGQRSRQQQPHRRAQRFRHRHECRRRQPRAPRGRRREATSRRCKSSASSTRSLPRPRTTSRSIPPARPRPPSCSSPRRRSTPRTIPVRSRPCRMSRAPSRRTRSSRPSRSTAWSSITSARTTRPS